MRTIILLQVTVTSKCKFAEAKKFEFSILETTSFYVDVMACLEHQVSCLLMQVLQSRYLCAFMVL